jgi:hypothetical protein
MEAHLDERQIDKISSRAGASRMAPSVGKNVPAN